MKTNLSKSNFGVMDNFVLQGDPGIEGPIGRPGPKVWMIAIAVQIISFSDFKF